MADELRQADLICIKGQNAVCLARRCSQNQGIIKHHVPQS